jgi:UDP-N-acetylglucosamine 1-carboxyvinyltransferase
MDRIIVRSGGPLRGAVRIGGAKNSVLKLMAACVLAEGRYTLRDVPGIVDVRIMSDILRSLGLVISTDPAAPAEVVIERPAEVGSAPDAVHFQRIRASTALLGPMLAATGHAVVTSPGGDDFGGRPIDLHLKGLEALGASFRFDAGLLVGEASELHGAEVVLEFPSVGATENILMAAVRAKGTTVLDNAAREPEIGDLCRFLNAMGAHIDGVGSATLTIRGVAPDELHGVDHTVVPDRVEAATYMCATGVAGGQVLLRNARADHMAVFLSKLRDAGLEIEPTIGGIEVAAPPRLRSVDVATLPYPGVATDYKPLLTAMLAVADGTCIITENVFNGRFRYIDELRLMGADLRCEDHHVVVRGVPRLAGAAVRAHDIRAGAALVVAALDAAGTTEIAGASHIDRGYDDLSGKLRALGADLERAP